MLNDEQADAYFAKMRKINATNDQFMISWDKIFPLITQMSVLKTYVAIVSATQEDFRWYSNKESRAKIQWRFQMAPSTVKGAITKLVKEELITIKSRGIYELSKDFLL